MMEEHNDVHVSVPIEPFELPLHKVELRRIVRDVGVESDEEAVPDP